MQFDTFQKTIEGWIGQIGLAYMFDRDFLKKYKELGGEYFTTDKFWDKYGISLKQAQYDRKHMYSMLRMTTRGIENRILDKHSKTQDGILVWIEFIDKYACNGSREIKIEKLELEISTPGTDT